ncbi:MAG: CHRD domain-containing protein [Ignavibacteria bacterium]|nr:CHRD domain-containing protein [Ignavibacteria bacterium]
MKTYKTTAVIIAMALLFIVTFHTVTTAGTYSISETLSGLEEVPPNASTGSGVLIGNYDDVTNTLIFAVSWQNFTAGTTAAHFHGPAPVGVNAGVQIGFTGLPLGVMSGSYSNTFVLTAAQEVQLLSGLWYVNIHSSTFPGGEVRSQLNPVVPTGNIFGINETLSGLEEVPPNASPATGTLVGTYDDNTNTIVFTVTWQDFIGTTTAAHFHGPALPGVNAGVQIGFTGFPVGVTSGSYGNIFVLTAAQETQLLGGLWYVNIHSSQFPGGEIRSQLNPDIVLPVELASFVSVISGNDVTLNWSTSSEINNSGFDIERSTSSAVWEKVGFVNGNGNSNESQTYTYSDKGLTAGVYNYRLKQIDFNGNFEYFNLSNEVVIGVPTAFDLSQNYPNPFNPETKIDYSVPVNENVMLNLYDMSGKLVRTLVNDFKSAGYYSYRLNASDLSSGIYIYKLESGSVSISKKLMLVK